MSIHTFPTTERRNRDIRSALGTTDKALHELLRKAVVAYRSGTVRTQGSLAHRHHLATAHTYLDAIETVLDIPNVAKELAKCLDAGSSTWPDLPGSPATTTGPPSPDIHLIMPVPPAVRRSGSTAHMRTMTTEIDTNEPRCDKIRDLFKDDLKLAGSVLLSCDKPLYHDNRGPHRMRDENGTITCTWRGADND